MTPPVQAPILTEIPNCAVTKTELPTGSMALTFIVPGIHAYSFVLDKSGRELVKRLCEPPITVVGDGKP